MAGKKGLSGRKPARESGIPAEFGKCSLCGKQKPGAEFYPNKGRRTLLSAFCRECTGKANLMASYRRAIRDEGTEVFQERITELEDRLKLMRRVLRESAALRKT
jgi:hypothetical protein